MIPIPSRMETWKKWWLTSSGQSGWMFSWDLSFMGSRETHAQEWSSGKRPTTTMSLTISSRKRKLKCSRNFRQWGTKWITIWMMTQMMTLTKYPLTRKSKCWKCNSGNNFTHLLLASLHQVWWTSTGKFSTSSTKTDSSTMGDSSSSPTSKRLKTKSLLVVVFASSVNVTKTMLWVRVFVLTDITDGSWAES